MYRHRVVEGLSQLISRYGSGGKDPMMRAVWYGIKGQIPSFLASLDSNEEAIAEIHQSIMEALDIEAPLGYRWDIQGVSIRLVPEIEEVSIVPIEAEVLQEVEVKVEEKPKPKRKPKAKKPKPTPVAEVEAVVEPAEESSGTEK